ncbi:hypothetical protein C8F04DRAFT_1047494 [Mycena alexandri]|uniref:Uncharacterized protein n=1 Tax=Mycena alexandri TaxID=1745969 RepID=A0AAD6SAA8_9AGAR|nr:hypothetical protein C8F04DRAFT_1047494 [Mycena alexandri]
MVALRFASFFLLSTAFTVLAAHLPSRDTAPAYKGPTPAPISLSSWAETQLTAVIKASSAPALNAAFDAFLSQGVNITFNNSPMSRATYVSLRLNKGFSPSASINYTGAIEVLDVANSTQAGMVALFFSDRVSSAVESAMNIVVAPDASLASHPGSDSRRVISINQIAVGV